MREYCPVTTIVGDNLTQRLLDDYRPYLRESSFPDFERLVRKDELIYGSPVTRIEMFGFHDGTPGYHTKWYWFGEYNPDCPDRELSNAMVGVERFPA